jgi:hypothetical protein
MAFVQPALMVRPKHFWKYQQRERKAHMKRNIDANLMITEW